MYLLTSLSTFLLALPASTLPTKRETCTNPLQRRAWHTLSPTDQHAYLTAEHCLMSRPSLTGVPGAQTRFDDLLGAHQHQAGWIHNTGFFLPWHRLHMSAHETLLRHECGYTGAQPYWDEPLDAGHFSTSPLLTSTAFGSTSSNDDCIADGIFASYTLHQGPGYENTAHCISRRIDDDVSGAAGQDSIDECLRQQSFSTAGPCIETNPHTGGHRGVGGVMDNAVSSPGDPLFYMHHTFLDRVWWQWQEKDLERRVRDIAGYTTGVEPEGGWVEVTLEDEMDMHGIVPGARIRELMDIRGGVLCYEYV